MNIHFFFGLKINEIEFKNKNGAHNSLNISNNETKFYYEICYATEHTFYHKFLSTFWTYIDIATYSILPFITMVICSSLILNETRKTREFFKKINMNRKLTLKRKKRDNKMTLIILITNLYFICCSLPYSISYNIIYKNSCFRQL